MPLTHKITQWNEQKKKGKKLNRNHAAHEYKSQPMKSNFKIKIKTYDDFYRCLAPPSSSSFAIISKCFPIWILDFFLSFFFYFFLCLYMHRKVQNKILNTEKITWILPEILSHLADHVYCMDTTVLLLLLPTCSWHFSVECRDLTYLINMLVGLD